MRKMKPADKRFYLVLSTIVATLLLWAVGSWVIGMMPKPLGDKLEYIGKSDYGCWYPLCDSRPASTYYYATEMKLDDVTHSLFTRAKLLEKPHESGITTGGGYAESYWLEFETRDGKEFTIDYYPHPENAFDSYGLAKTNKPSIISMDSKVYPIAKDSL